MKISGTIEELKFIKDIILDIEIYCENCPVYDQCQNLNEIEEESIGGCGATIWHFIKREVIA